MGKKTRQSIYREEGSSIKRNFKDQCLVNSSHPITDLRLFQALADKHSKILERLLVAPGQLKMSSIFPVLLFSTSHLDCFLSWQNNQLSEVASQCVTQGYNVDVQASIQGPKHTGL